MKMKFCHLCGMPIGFVGEHMIPVDFEPVQIIEGEGEETYLNENGETVKGRLERYLYDGLKEKRAVYVPHERTCIDMKGSEKNE